MIRFHDGTTQDYRVPCDTREPRCKACRDHHPACDCREAEHAEQIAELSATIEQMTRAVQVQLRGHRIEDWISGSDGGGGPACECDGCRLVRTGLIGWWVPTDENGCVLPPEDGAGE